LFAIRHVSHFCEVPDISTDVFEELRKTYRRLTGVSFMKSVLLQAIPNRFDDNDTCTVSLRRVFNFGLIYCLSRTTLLSNVRR